MISAQRIAIALVTALGLGFIAAPVVVAKGKHEHVDGAQLLADRIHKNGRHKIAEKGSNQVFVDVRNNKVAGLHVKGKGNAELPVKKYKSSKKMARVDGIMPAAFILAQSGTQYLGTTYIGYSYIDEYGDEVIYWFPYDMVEDLDTGAIEYIPA